MKTLYLFTDNFYDMADRYHLSGSDARRLWNVSKIILLLHALEVSFIVITFQHMTKAKNIRSDREFRMEIEKLVFEIRMLSTAKQRSFAKYAVGMAHTKLWFLVFVFWRCFFPRTTGIMMTLDRHSRMPHLEHDLPVDSTNNVAESMNNAFKAMMGRIAGTLDEIINAGVELGRRHKDRVYM